METAGDMQTRNTQLEAELQRKNQQLIPVHDEYMACFRVIESKLTAFCQKEQEAGAVANSNANQKSLVNKPGIFTGDTKDSLKSFIGHMNLYVASITEDTKLRVGVIFLGGHEFVWFKVTSKVNVSRIGRS